jgi:hypothetical protein
MLYGCSTMLLLDDQAINSPLLTRLAAITLVLLSLLPTANIAATAAVINGWHEREQR